ncbi:MAG TPA: hypothetical protein VGE74_19295 [Gemmata sp.]
MNEKRWFACKEPRALLEHVGKTELWTGRKVRLFAVACCRRLAHLMPGKVVRAALETAEQFADGRATAKKLKSAADHAWAAQRGPFLDDERAELGAYATAAEAVYRLCGPPDAMDITEVLDGIYSATVCDPDNPEEEDTVQVAFVREIFGNPFLPVAFSPSWRTSTVLALASQMYESRDFSAMTILADALQDAGCDNDDILAHCRGDGPHVRGCWVVDLVLGKA